MRRRIIPEWHTEVYKRLAVWVRRVRKEKGLTQQELSAELGRGAKYIWRIEHSRHRPNFVEYLDLMEALGLDPSEAVLELRIGTPSLRLWS